MKTALRKARTTGTVHGLKSVGDPADGIFEAYVSVFGNVDHHGDRIVPGAFAASIDRWKASGDPVPVIFSHQWDNLDAHIGSVLDLEEHHPGDPRLAGTGLEEHGGLWARFEVELDEDFAARVAKKMTKRTVREFSFAYDVLDEARGSDGVNELRELDVLEVGPTLKGANPATVLLSKTLGDGWETLGEGELLDRLAVAVDEHRAKARVEVSTFEGSVEEDLEALFAAGYAWAAELNVGAGGFYALHQAATYPAELRAVVVVEGWADPFGEGIFYELTYERDEETGALSVAEAAELEVSVDLARKARAMKHRGGRSAATAKARGTVADEPKTGKGEINAEDPATGNAEESDSRTGSEDEDDEVDPVLVELELVELELS